MRPTLHYYSLLLVIFIGLFACKKTNNESPLQPVVTGADTTFGTYGDKVIITGSNFSTDPAKNTVTFNNVTARVTEASPTRLVVNVPSNALSGEIKVAGAQNQKSIYFNVVTPGTPFITRIDPVSGSGPGNRVTLTGTGFDKDYSKNGVNFNGAPAIVLNATATALVVLVPAKGTSGPVTVTTNGRTSVPFNYQLGPVSPLADGRFYFASAIINTGQTILSKGTDTDVVPGSNPYYIELVSNGPTLENGNVNTGLAVEGLHGFWDLDGDKDQVLFMANTLTYATSSSNPTENRKITRFNYKGDVNKTVIYSGDNSVNSKKGTGELSFAPILVDNRDHSIYATKVKRGLVGGKLGFTSFIVKGNTDGTIPLSPVYSFFTTQSEPYHINLIGVSASKIYFIVGSYFLGYRLGSIDLNGANFKVIVILLNGQDFVCNSNKSSDKLYSLNTTTQVISAYDPITEITSTLYDRTKINLTGNNPNASLGRFLVANNHIYWQVSYVDIHGATITKLLRADIDGSTTIPSEIYTRVEPALEGVVSGGKFLLDLND